jgi:hypothetical protein
MAFTCKFGLSLGGPGYGFRRRLESYVNRIYGRVWNPRPLEGFQGQEHWPRNSLGPHFTSWNRLVYGSGISCPVKGII